MSDDDDVGAPLAVPRVPAGVGDDAGRRDPAVGATPTRDVDAVVEMAALPVARLASVARASEALRDAASCWAPEAALARAGHPQQLCLLLGELDHALDVVPEDGLGALPSLDHVPDALA